MKLKERKTIWFSEFEYYYEDFLKDYVRIPHQFPFEFNDQAIEIFKDGDTLLIELKTTDKSVVQTLFPEIKDINSKYKSDDGWYWDKPIRFTLWFDYKYLKEKFDDARIYFKIDIEIYEED